MPLSRFLPAGTIVTTHGVRGEVKLRPAADSAAFLLSLPVFYLNEQPVRPVSARVHKSMLLLTLPGVDSVDAAMGWIGKTLFFDRADVTLPPDTYYLADLIGLSVFDTRLGRVIGKITDVLQPPAHDVYVVSDGKNEVLIPAVPAFVERVDAEKGTVIVKTWEGMGGDAAN